MDVHDQVGFIHRESSKGDLFVILVLNPFNLYFVSLLSVTPFNIYRGRNNRSILFVISNAVA